MKRPFILSDATLAALNHTEILRDDYRALKDYVLLLEEQLPDAMAHVVFFGITTVKPEPPVV